METCYMCHREETSREHVPPKCLFPEQKDVGHSKYRKNLITVPSCDLHNSKKSKDDEFLMISIAGIVGNNSIGYEHYAGKVTRALKRTSFTLLSKVFLARAQTKIKFNDNKFLNVIVGTPDIDRLRLCFEHIAYGIYRHHFGKRFIGKVKTILGFLVSTDKNPQNFKKFVKHKFSIELKNKELLGENPDVFYYQFTDIDENGVYGLKMCFYRGVDVYVSFAPEGVELPFNLGVALMNDGVKTVFELEGKKYEIN